MKTLPLLLTTFTCGAGLSAQAPTAQSPQTSPIAFSDFRTPIHTMDPDPIGGEYGIWAAGDHYKVSFHGDMTFIPYLGAQYPETVTWSWRTLGVRIGEQELVTGGTHAERSRTDWRYEYRYGPVTERYDVLGEGVEQSFVVYRRPAVPGDLVVRGRITANVSAADAEPAHQELVFADASGRELVRYGKAFVYDATGRKADIATGYESGVVTLTVPAAWLAEATFPITVDPLTNPVWIQGGPGAPPESLDLATAGGYLISTVARSVSATDQDAWGFQSSLIFRQTVMVFMDITPNWSTEEPCVAGLDSSQTGVASSFVLAVKRQSSTRSGSWLAVHARTAGNTTVNGPVQTLLPPSGAGDSRPDLGGMRSANALLRALLVWQRTSVNGGNSTILARAFDSSGNPTGPEFVVARGTTFTDNQRPSITQFARNISGRWVVVWQKFVPINGAGTWTLHGARVDAGGSVAEVWSSARNGNTAIHKVGPKVDGDSGDNYLVAYTTIPTSSSTRPQGIAGDELVVEVADFITSSSHTDVTLRSGSTGSWEVGGVAFDRGVTRQQWAVTFHEQGAASISRIGRRGSELETHDFLSGSGLPVSGGVTMSWRLPAAGYLAIYSHRLGLANLIGRRLLLPVPAGPFLLGMSCGSGTIRVDGPRLIPSTAILRLDNAEPTAQGQIAFLPIAFNSSNLPVPSNLPFWPGCMLNVDLGASLITTFIRVISNTGSAEVFIHLPDTLQTFRITGQWFYVDPGSQQTPLLRATQGLRVEFAR